MKIQDQSFVDNIKLLNSSDEKESVMNVIDAMLTKKENTQSFSRKA